MKLARVGEAGYEIPIVLDDAGIAHDARSITSTYDATYFHDEGVARTRVALDAGHLPEFEVGSRRIGPPVARPSKIVCAGLNYLAHAEEARMAVPSEPILFMKASSSYVGPDDAVQMPIGASKLDWEVELGLVISRPALYLASPEEARSYVAGVAIAHDVSERAFQLERGGQWMKGKSCPTFHPFGPYLDVDDGAVEQERTLTLSVNGVVRQQASTAQMIHSALYLVWYISQFMALEPGDVIDTGTPAGVALGAPDEPWLRIGDVVELEITGLGRQRQEIVAPAHTLRPVQ